MDYDFDWVLNSHGFAIKGSLLLLVGLAAGFMTTVFVAYWLGRLVGRGRQAQKVASKSLA